ncbi:ABC transporter permease [Aeromicrobium sp. SMF47]|uniref:Xylose transport system permease protein XylH n=1 Tax=Aeromicrobium yanjiei TaxID=2662028 RepID=A0A5Q2MID2_9ACTN|nr:MULTISPECIES: ABC transporter permease [Aeromicrobium]MRJ78121.1 ABC transporter permease [Aeromicrobium yanjiei]MRK03247.1 ABC transporter permease [Aeromicrobium sp. S22]QGG40806.1 ABC transporter permease [Aeromicrobium yanjiei]
MATATVGDERIARTSTLTKLMKRPEIGALAAAVVIFVFFAVSTDTFARSQGVATWLSGASTIGIMAVAVALLMIGGEFDLSAGAITGTTGLVVGILTTEYGLNVWAAIFVSLAIALFIGLVNGILVMRTGLPSFIVTLGTFFVLQGVNLAGTKALIGQVAIQGLSNVPFYDQAQAVFGGSIDINGSAAGGQLRISVFWWLGVTALATWVLLRTRVGNWIFAVGGAQTSARQVGVPVFKTKVGLFMTTAGAGWLVGMLLVFRTSTVQAGTGVGQEFIYIICAVVGGCLMTGGYGSAIGAAFGALIYSMVNAGIVYSGWENDWLFAFLGVMLLVAVLLNEWVRKRAELAR